MAEWGAADGAGWAAIALGALATYLWRAIGVAASGRVSLGSRAFAWVEYVAYGILAALVARMIVQPIGGLSEIPTTVRVTCALAGLAVFWAGKRNVAAGVSVGAGLLAVYAALS